MNRLAHPPENRGALRIILDHLADSHPDEHHTALAMLDDPAYGATQIARDLTVIAREDNLGVRVGEKAVRDWREKGAA